MNDPQLCLYLIIRPLARISEKCSTEAFLKIRPGFQQVAETILTLQSCYPECCFYVNHPGIVKDKNTFPSKL